MTDARDNATEAAAIIAALDAWDADHGHNPDRIIRHIGDYVLTEARLRAVLAEIREMREAISGLRTEYGVRWRPRGSNSSRPWIDDDIDGMTEAAAKAHAATRPEGRVVRRLVGEWRQVGEEGARP